MQEVSYKRMKCSDNTQYLLKQTIFFLPFCGWQKNFFSTFESMDILRLYNLFNHYLLMFNIFLWLKVSYSAWGGGILGYIGGTGWG